MITTVKEKPVKERTNEEKEVENLEKEIVVGILENVA